MPVAIVTGPEQSKDLAGVEDDVVPRPPHVYIVDQGRTVSPLSRGKIMRINPCPCAESRRIPGFAA